MTAGRTIRWGVMSTAGIAQKHVMPAMQRAGNCQVLAIASRSLERASAVADQFDIPRHYGSYEALLQDPDVDAVYVPLPTGLHAEWCVRCAEAGKPTLCEKPLAANAEEARRMVEAFRKHNVPFAEALMYRFHPRIKAIRDIVRRGDLGQLRLIQTSFSAQAPDRSDFRFNPELGGGALRDVGSYCISLMRLLAAEEPEAVSAEAHVGQESGVDEWMVGTLRFPSGLLGTFTCSLVTEFGCCCDIYGSEARAMLPKGVVPNPDEEAPIRLWRDYQLTEERIEPADQYQLMVEDFADALLGERAPQPDPEESVRNMQVLDCLMQAAGV